MKIEFFKKDTGELIDGTDGVYFVMSNEVYKDNFETWESQQAVIGFDNCIERCKDVGWRLVIG